MNEPNSSFMLALYGTIIIVILAIVMAILHKLGKNKTIGYVLLSSVFCLTTILIALDVGGHTFMYGLHFVFNLVIVISFSAIAVLEGEENMGCLGKVASLFLLLSTLITVSSLFMGEEISPAWLRDVLQLIVILFALLIAVGSTETGKQIRQNPFTIFLAILSLFVLFRFFVQDVTFIATFISAVILLSFLLFELKKKARKIYGTLEIFIALATAFDVVRKLNEQHELSLNEMIDNIDPFELFKLLSAVYIFIRGLDNISEAGKKEDRSLLFLSLLEQEKFISAEMVYHIGIEKNCKNGEGDSAFHIAVKKKSFAMIDFLWQFQFPTDMRNAAQQTPEQLAKESGDYVIAGYLKTKIDTKASGSSVAAKPNR